MPAIQVPHSAYVSKAGLCRWLEVIHNQKPFSSPDDINFKQFVKDLQKLAQHWEYKPGWVNFKSQLALKEVNVESSQLTLDEALELHPYVTDQEYIKIAKDILNSKSNIFIQGKAGSGKSTMISILSKILTKCKVCTPTGTAAINLMDMGIQARTIHSMFGILVAPVPQFRDEERSLKNYKGTIIIDEISMVDCYLLDLIMKNNPDTRWIFFGDMAQLQPVVTMEDPTVREFWNSEYGGIFTWLNSNEVKRKNFKYLELQSVFRQDNDAFIELLNKVRDNSIEWDELLHINRRRVLLEEFEKHNPIYTHLVQTNAEARRINEIKYSENTNPEFKFIRVSKNIPDPDNYAPEVVALKVGCKVMCLHNIKGHAIPECREDEFNDIIVSNGNIGEVVEIEETMGVNKVKCNFNNRVITIEPHTFEIFNSIKVPSFEEIPINIRQTGKNYFQLKNGVWIYNEMIGSVTQLLLGVCFAITIHKSQGHTLNAAYLSFTYPCEAAAYVALSRVRSLDNIGLRFPIKKNCIVAPTAHIPFIETMERFYNTKKVENNF